MDQRFIKLLDTTSLLYFLIGSTVCFYLFFFAEVEYWVRLLFDDTYYYLGLVNNLVEYGKSQFMPPLETNGYQPLWLLLLWGLAELLGVSHDYLPHLVFSLSFLFSLAFIYYTKKKYDYYFPAVIVVYAFWYIFGAGLETCMLPILIVLYFNCESYKAKSVLSIFILLSRLDALAFVCAYSLLKILEKRDFKALLPVASAFFALALYMLINHVYFGLAVPVSGLSKSLGNELTSINWQPVGVFLEHLPKLILMAVAIIVIGINKKFRNLPFRFEMSVLCLTFAVCASYYLSFSTWGAMEWYLWSLSLLCFYMILSIVTSLNLARFKHLLIVALLILPIAFSSIVNSARSYYAFAKSQHVVEQRGSHYALLNLELVKYIKQELPSKLTFLMGDRAGSFGFFLGSGYGLIQLEGLVASKDFYNARKNGTVFNFLDKYKPDFYIVDTRQYLENSNYYGFLEPMLAYPDKLGITMFCFPKDAVVLDQSYFDKHKRKSIRLLIDYKERETCPMEWQNKFDRRDAALLDN